MCGLPLFLADVGVERVGLFFGGAAGVLQSGSVPMRTGCPSNCVETCVQNPLFNGQKMYYIFKKKEVDGKEAIR